MNRFRGAQGGCFRPGTETGIFMLWIIRWRQLHTFMLSKMVVGVSTLRLRYRVVSGGG